MNLLTINLFLSCTFLTNILTTLKKFLINLIPYSIITVKQLIQIF